MIEKKEFQGYASIIILSCFLHNFIILNLENYWGLYQEYYINNDIFKDSTILEISLVGSLSKGLSFGFSLLVTPIISKFGYKNFLYSGVLLCSLGTFLSSYATKVWHLYLTLGIMFGIGSSFIETIVASVPILWFKENISLAMGIVYSGAGVGGLVINMLNKYIINILDIKWSFRIIAIIQFSIGIISSYLIKKPNNLQNNNSVNINNKKHFNIKVIKKNCFLLWFFASIIFSFVYMIPLTFIPSYSTFINIDKTSSAVFISVASGSSALGKIIIGLISDRYGIFNISIICFLILSLSCLLIWTFSKTWESVFSFSFIFGLFSGVYFTIMGPITVIITNISDFNSGIAIILFGISIGTVLSTPISSLLLNNNSYLGLILYTGFLYVLITICLIVLKIKVKSQK
jgi:MFS family permease